jgi:pimeloyl-ACP methyl ester carboxylesterase
MSITLLNYTQTGAGEPLLIIHGLFGSSRNWQSLSRKFANDFNVICVDLRNHGDSPHLDDMGYEAMAEDVLQLIDHLQLSQVSMLGHSMGGKVAMKLCQLRPEKIKNLVIADIAPVEYKHDYDELIEAVLKLDLSSIKNRKQADTELSQGIPDPRIRMFLLQNLVSGENGFQWKLNWRAIQENMHSIIGFDDISDWHIDNPSLFIYGGQSNYLNTANQRLINQHFTNASFNCIENAGHWLHAEQPEPFFTLVNDYLT